jgi:hypothetical protein
MAMGATPPVPNPTLQWMLWNHQPVTVSYNVAATTTTASNANAQGQMVKKYMLADTLPLAYRAATTGNVVPSLPSNTEKGQMPKSKAGATSMLTIGQAQTECGEPVPIKAMQQQQPTLGVFGWTPEEDWRLTDMVKKYKNPVNWEPIAKALGGSRT